MALDFNKFAQEGNAFVNRLAAGLGLDDQRDRAGRMLRTVLHSLREIIPFQESFHVLSQMPMFLKAVYVDGWDWKAQPANVETYDEFLRLVEAIDHRSGARQGDPELTLWAVETILTALKQYMDEGLLEHLRSTTHPGVHRLWEPLMDTGGAGTDQERAAQGGR